jgi:hypothetical protein
MKLARTVTIFAAVVWLIAGCVMAHAQSPSPWREPGTQWSAVVEDYEMKGYRDFVVDNWHVWQALKSGNTLIWSNDDRAFGYSCRPRWDSGTARCKEYNLATGNFVRVVIRPVPIID